jgi:hypothetical protein
VASAISIAAGDTGSKDHSGRIAASVEEVLLF